MKTIKMIFYYIVILIFYSQLLAYDILTFKRSATKSGINDKSFIIEKTISYPDMSQVHDRDLKRVFNYYLKPFVDEYQNINLKNEIKDSDISSLNTTWQDSTILSVFCRTKFSISFECEKFGYNGGIHGYDMVSYTNYDLKSAKVIKLEDFISSNEMIHFKEIAQNYYRKFFSLSKNSSLIDDGWFKNEFVLAKTFAITNAGLLMHYDSYEIKPYCFGMTEYLIPWYALHNVMKKDSLLIPLTKKDLSLNAILKDSKVSLSLNAHRVNNKDVEITLFVKSSENIDKIWTSLSFVQLRKNHPNIEVIHKKGDFKLKSYKHKSMISTKNHAITKAKYLLVEAEKIAFKQGDSFSFTFKLSLPPKLHEFIIDLRAVYAYGGHKYNLPDFYGAIGQQGYKNQRYFLY